jgi:hypothetical protein
MPQHSDALSPFDDATKDAVHAAIRARPTRREHYGQGAMAAAWFDDAGRFLELLDFHRGEFSTRQAVQGFALASLVKRGIELASKRVVVVKYTARGFLVHQDTSDINFSLAKPLASVGIEVLDVAIVLDDTIRSLLGKIAPPMK